MITEDYVSLELARQLKEKGFMAITNRYFNAQYGEIRTVSDTFMMDWNNEEHMSSITMPNSVAIPTLQMAMKWLREVHNITIGITFSLDIITYEIQKDKKVIIAVGSSRSYEVMIEDAIKYCLENLI